MKLEGKALIVLLGEQAQERTICRVSEDYLLHIADRCDPELARLMRRVADAQGLLDTYVLERTDVGGARSK